MLSAEAYETKFGVPYVAPTEPGPEPEVTNQVTNNNWNVWKYRRERKDNAQKH